MSRSGALASELFEQHSEMVLSVCCVLLLDRADAEDAMQQTFFSAYRSILAGSEPRRPAPWLATIARNECLNRIRARTRAPLAEAVSRATRGAPDALNSAIAREDLHTLGRTIRELPDQQREALLLHEFHGLPYRDVAAAIGVSESAIASLLFRARARLRSAQHRAYAALPIPALWNAVDRLSTPASATKAAAPMIAKLGTAAVAVGLTAGTGVVVEHDVGSHHRPSPPSPPHRSAAPTTAPILKETAGRNVAKYLPAVSPSTVGPTPGDVHGRARRTGTAHDADHASSAAKHGAVRASQAIAVSSRSNPAQTTPKLHQRPNSASANSGRARSSSAGTKRNGRQSHDGRPPGKTAPPGQQHKQGAQTSGGLGSHATSGSSPTSGLRPTPNPHGNGTQKEHASPAHEQPSTNNGQGNPSSDQGNGHTDQGDNSNKNGSH